jgi:hypothetical protein
MAVLRSDIEASGGMPAPSDAVWVNGLPAWPGFRPLCKRKVADPSGESSSISPRGLTACHAPSVSEENVRLASAICRHTPCHCSLESPAGGEGVSAPASGFGADAGETGSEDAASGDAAVFRPVCATPEIPASPGAELPRSPALNSGAEIRVAECSQKRSAARRLAPTDKIKGSDFMNAYLSPLKQSYGGVA